MVYRNFALMLVMACSLVGCAALAGGACRVIWPRMGEIYSRSNPLYAQYACYLGNRGQSEGFVTSGHESTNISGQVDLSCLDSNDGISTPIGSIGFSYAHPIRRNSIVDEFTLQFTSSCTAVRSLFSIFQSSELIDSIEVVIIMFPDEYFESSMLQLKVDSMHKCIYNASSQSCVEGSQTLPPRYYDFVEIGTSGYDTLIEQASDWHVGLSVEVLKDLQDTLPDRAGVIKVNAAIGDEAGWKDIYFLPKSTLDFFGYKLSSDKISQDMHGLGRIGAPNPSFVTRMREKGAWDVNPLLLQRRMVRVQPVGQLLAEHGVSAIGFLKIDTEGYDVRILTAVLKYISSNPDKLQYPRIIEFESSFDAEGSFLIIDKLLALGYSVYSISYGTENDVHSKHNLGLLGVVYAELREESENYWDQIKFPTSLRVGTDGVNPDSVTTRISGILSPHFIAFRRFCADYHSKTPVDESGKNAIYCNILTSSLSHDTELRIIGVSSVVDRS